MAKLRIYNAGDGDCIAVRNGYRTRLVFDTGRKSSYKRGLNRTDSRGFGLALFDAVGRRATMAHRSWTQNDRRRSPPAVVISHVDADHVGGLLAWAEDILKKSSSWTEAKHIAQQEIKEVWCNIPARDRALIRLAGIPALGEEQLELEWVSPETDQHLFEQWLNEDFQESDSPQNSRRVDYDRLRRLDNFSRNRLERKGDDRNATPLHEEQLETHITHNDVTWLRQSLVQAFPEEEDFITKLITLAPVVLHLSHIDNDSVGDTLTISLSLGSIRTGVHIDIAAKNGRYRGAYSRTFEAIPRFLEYRYSHITFQFNTFTEHDGAQHPAISISHAIEEIGSAIDECGTAHDAIRYCLSIARRTPCNDDRQLDKLAILESVLGVSDIEGVSSRINLFITLSHLGIPVRDFVLKKDCLSVEGETIHVLSPSAAERTNVLHAWKTKIEPRLSVPSPSFGIAMLLSRAASEIVTWDADRSVTNLSSIGLWIEKIGKRSSVVLTGDGIHGKIIDGLKEVASRVKANPSRLCYQIPHHGGRHNTDVRDVKSLPRCAFRNQTKISVAFAVGGSAKAGIADSSKAPAQEVLEFHKKGARKVIASRRMMNEAEGTANTYLDIDLP